MTERLTVKDAAAILNVSEKSIHSWIEQDVIPAYRAGEHYEFRRTELLEWAAARHSRVSVESRGTPSLDESQLPSLLEAVEAGGIAYKLAGDDKPAVLRAVAEVVRLPHTADHGVLLEMLLAREELGSTGIGGGIALPHVRNPVVLPVDRPTVTVCFLERAIDYQAIDGQRVNTLFALISPNVRSHLHLLARVGFVLQDREFKSALKRAAPRDELLAKLAGAEAALPAADDRPRSRLR